MSARSEYIAAKKEYHRAGKALAHATGASRTERRRAYVEATREYHRTGNRLRKGK
jgi:hypothetical protein